MNKLPNSIGEEDNYQLLAPISSKEVHLVFFAMGAFKTLGLDGFPQAFFQDYWKIFSYDVTKVVKDFFRTGKLLKKLNNTYIVLVPKSPNPNCMKDFWPISLYNSIYKIISKVLVNRINPLLDNFISPS